jgi:hypothetical protein
MLKSKNTNKTTLVLVVAVLAAIMTFGPSVSNFQTAMAHYGVDKDDCKDNEDYYEDHEEACDKNLKEHYGKDYDGNFASQAIGQEQDSEQNSQVVSGEDSVLSGNNINLQNQENSGSNALAQNGGDDDDDDDGNSARQGIGQSQSSEQNSQVVSGEDSVGSGNNISFQNQENSGSNAAAQQ